MEASNETRDKVQASGTATNYENWMGELPKTLHSVPLNTIAIPGSHNSASYFLDKSAPVAPDQDETLQRLARVSSSFVKDIIYRWAQTQSLDLNQQLRAGIRYLDLRLACRPDTEDIYTVHGLYNNRLETSLRDISTYVNSHPKEIVFLDFNHAYHMNDAMHVQCMDMILDIFGDKVCPLLDLESMTLETLWENQLQVIVFYHQKLAKDLMMFWPGDRITSPYPETDDVGKLLTFLEARYQTARPADRFYVTQAVLTPTPASILSHVTGSLKQSLATKVVPPMCDWLQSKGAGAQGVNICISDFVEMGNFIPSLLALNGH